MPAVFLSSAGDGGLALMLVIIFALTVYFFPALVAIVREHGGAAEYRAYEFLLRLDVRRLGRRPDLGVL